MKVKKCEPTTIFTTKKHNIGEEPLAEKPNGTCPLYVLYWLMVWISRMYAMPAVFSPSMWTFRVTIDCWIETPGVAGTGGGGGGGGG